MFVGEADPGGNRMKEMLTCVGCGYDLRATAADAACPECGQPVAASLADACWMTRRELATLLIRLLVLWLAIRSLMALFWQVAVLVGRLFDPSVGVHFGYGEIAQLVSWLMHVAVVVAVWFLAPRLARWTVRRDGRAFATVVHGPSSWLGLGCVLLGLYFVVQGLSQVVFLLLHLGDASRQDMVFFNSGSGAVQLLAGVAMILGGHRQRRMVDRSRTFAVDRSSCT